jgi:cytoskeletal protein CcmA (bactofilin family)
MALTRSPLAGKHEPDISSAAVVGAGTRVRGRVTGDGDLTVLGHLEGEVHLRGELVVGEGGQVVSDIEASALRVAGSVEGDVHVSGDVLILAGAKVRGDMHGASVALEEGADLDGRLDCEFKLPAELEEGAGNSRVSNASTGRR